MTLYVCVFPHIYVSFTRLGLTFCKLDGSYIKMVMVRIYIKKYILNSPRGGGYYICGLRLLSNLRQASTKCFVKLAVGNVIGVALQTFDWVVQES